MGSSGAAGPRLPQPRAWRLKLPRPSVGPKAAGRASVADGLGDLDERRARLVREAVEHPRAEQPLASLNGVVRRAELDEHEHLAGVVNAPEDPVPLRRRAGLGHVLVEQRLPGVVVADVDAREEECHPETLAPLHKRLTAQLPEPHGAWRDSAGLLPRRPAMVHARRSRGRGAEPFSTIARAEAFPSPHHAGGDAGPLDRSGTRLDRHRHKDDPPGTGKRNAAPVIFSNDPKEPPKGLISRLIDKIGPSNADSVPLPLLVLAGIAFLLLAAAGGSFVARRIQARRVMPAPAPAEGPRDHR